MTKHCQNVEMKCRLYSQLHCVLHENMISENAPSLALPNVYELWFCPVATQDQQATTPAGKSDLYVLPHKICMITSSCPQRNESNPNLFNASYTSCGVPARAQYISSEHWGGGHMTATAEPPTSQYFPKVSERLRN